MYEKNHIFLVRFVWFVWLLQAQRKRGAAGAAAPPKFLLSKNVLKKILFTLQFLDEELNSYFIVIKNIDLVYYKCNSCVYQTLNKGIVFKMKN